MKLRKCIYQLGGIDSKHFTTNVHYFHGWFSCISNGQDMPRGLLEDSRTGGLVMKDYWKIKFIDDPELSEAVTSPGTQAEQSHTTQDK